jgi:glycosyltransferase involved in cell wall biosynthesis
LKISFITSMGAYPWGGSEELWQMAARNLSAEGYKVTALYPIGRGWHSKMDELVRDGVSVSGFGLKNPRLNGWAAALHGKLAGETAPTPWPAPGQWRKSDLVVISQGGISDGLPWLETALDTGSPYAVIVQANMVAGWPDDKMAERLRRAYAGARRVYFVSEDTLRLFRIQIAYEADNAEVIWNPLNPATPRSPMDWPDAETEGLNLAMVGRIEPFAKGQDLALESFANKRIRDLPIHLSIYGEGPWTSTCQRNIKRLELENVVMRGTATPLNVWQKHHALLLPSRHEGTALVMLEALWLGRPVITTRVAGALSEITDGHNGYFINDTSAEAVTEGLLRTWNGMSTLQQLGANGARLLRERMPSDPGAVLAKKLRELLC